MTVMIASTSSGTSTAAMPVAASWWLKDIDNPDNNFPVFIDGPKGMSLKSDIEQAAFNAFGRKGYIVISDVVKGEQFTFMIQMFEADRTKFDDMRTNLHNCLMQSDMGEQWFIRFDSRTRNIITSGEYSTYDVTAYEITRPAP